MERTGFRGGRGSGGRSGGRSSGRPGEGGRKRSFGPGSRESNTGGGRGGFEEGKGRFMRKKVCRLCAERNPGLDYKDTERLTKFLTEKGKILPQRISGNCTKHQRMLARAVKRARHSSLIAFEMGV